MKQLLTPLCLLLLAGCGVQPEETDDVPPLITAAETGDLNYGITVTLY
ncbi:MAG: hypothetical protein KJ558_09755 [Gammaproteobacteria bacterium]|nr:hypothetical protein [Gammaproteobacteria bacterium]MBU1655089.1 hypothetical protein [Gammaproteobacteria bacterium]MBU1961561.1 hypothetical protein [Gammaproteobacteria bacterium]